MASERQIVLCDWCDGLAVSFISRGDRSSRRFFCDLHRADYDRDLSDWWTKPVLLTGRSRFDDCDFETVEKWVNRQARATRKKAKVTHGK